MRAVAAHGFFHHRREEQRRKDEHVLNSAKAGVGSSQLGSGSLSFVPRAKKGQERE